MRGANHVAKTEGVNRTGSSPHARGKRKSSNKTYRQTRIIPACAGQTQEKKEESELSTDHPRMRGANSELAIRVQGAGGSSPHARGKLKIYYLKTVNYKRHKNYQIYRYKNYSSYVYLKFRNTISNNPRVRGKL